MADDMHESRRGSDGDSHGDRDARSRHAFAVLQDKYVHARRLACCPTMDLVAVLTVDGQLIVHRTISWQRLLHVKPSEVSFEITTLEWSPDGLSLALGCDEGEVVVYEIESGEQRQELRALKRLRDFQHCCAITAMHWAACDQSQQQQQQQGQRRSESYFGQRAERFLQPSSVSTAAAAAGAISTAASSVLVTADADSEIVLWWMGKIYLAKVDIKTLLPPGNQDGDHSTKTKLTIDSVRLAPDLLRLFVVLLVDQDDDAKDSGNTPEDPDLHHKSKKHQLVTLDLSAIRAIQQELAFVAHTMDENHGVLNELVLSMRQMATEWKTATRIFELKMGLIGSLYEKYACADPPQVDMLSVVASGITSPALAQYFAQDIQEMSVDRMQKLLLSGCQTLAALIEGSMKAGLVKLLFHLSELRGRAKWQRAAFEDTMGVATSAVDDLITIAQDFLISMEIFAHAVHETRQDFVLFFQWVLERIRIHTNSTTGRSNGAGAASAAQGDATKSLLNQRRLCNFLQRAAEEAQSFRERQLPSSKYRVETTFGNLVSKQLAKPTASAAPVEGGEGASSVLMLLERLESKCVEEYSFHDRVESEAISHGDDEEDEDEDDSDGEDALDAVDWSSLESVALAQNQDAARSLLMLGVRLKTNQLVLLRASWSSGPQDNKGQRLNWETMKLAPPPNAAAHKSDAQLQGFHFYGDTASGKKEQLAFLLTKTSFQDGAQQQQDWLYFQSYDQHAFSPLRLEVDAPLTAILPELPECSLPTSGMHRARLLSTSSVTANASIPRVIANAKRGIVCVSTLANRLTILDAEDDEDDEEEEEGVEELEKAPSRSEPGHLRGHESDSNEVDM